MNKKIFGEYLIYQEGQKTNKRDTGTTGDILEILTRDLLYARGVKASDIRARKASQVDAMPKINGSRIKIEIKSGSGAVAYASDSCLFTGEDRQPNNILPTADYVIWYPLPTKALLENELELSAGYVFTREQFINCLVAMGAKERGLYSSLTVTKGGRQLQIQTITKGNLARIETYILKEGVPTFADWMTANGR